MLQVLNKTPFEVALALVNDQHGSDIVTVAIKGTFKIPARHGDVKLAEEQLSVRYSDEYYGEPGKSSIKYPVDLVLGKINTDIGLIGRAHSPDQRPVEQLPVSLKVGELQKTILVIGDRCWKRNTFSSDFCMTNPVPFIEMPLIYERAFGGTDQSHENEKKHGWDNRNPLGTGFRLNENTVDGHRVPNLTSPDHIISNWRDKLAIACYGFIEGTRESRLKYAGTYDDAWAKNQFPLLPKDFDLRFFNSAAPGLIAKGFLTGCETVQLVNLSEKGNLEFNLPKLEIRLMFRLGDTRNYQNADLWTVVLEPDEDRFYLVWGAAFCVGKQPSRMKYVKVEMDGESKAINLLREDAARKEYVYSIGAMVGNG